MEIIQLGFCNMKQQGYVVCLKGWQTCRIVWRYKACCTCTGDNDTTEGAILGVVSSISLWGSNPWSANCPWTHIWLCLGQCSLEQLKTKLWSELKIKQCKWLGDQCVNSSGPLGYLWSHSLILWSKSQLRFSTGCCTEIYISGRNDGSRIFHMVGSSESLRGTEESSIWQSGSYVRSCLCYMQRCQKFGMLQVHQAPSCYAEPLGRYCFSWNYSLAIAMWWKCCDTVLDMEFTV